MPHTTGFEKRIRANSGLSPFQKKVLLAVLSIPRGEVRTYAWVAARINSPKACRAVGGALSRNPYDPYVPCHRVISSDGSLGGYSGGPGKKKRLLEEEGSWPLPGVSGDGKGKGITHSKKEGLGPGGG